MAHEVKKVAADPSLDELKRVVSPMIRTIRIFSCEYCTRGRWNEIIFGSD